MKTVMGLIELQTRYAPVQGSCAGGKRLLVIARRQLCRGRQPVRALRYVALQTLSRKHAMPARSVVTEGYGRWRV